MFMRVRGQWQRGRATLPPSSSRLPSLPAKVSTFTRTGRYFWLVRMTQRVWPVQPLIGWVNLPRTSQDLWSVLTSWMGRPVQLQLTSHSVDGAGSNNTECHKEPEGRRAARDLRRPSNNKLYLLGGRRMILYTSCVSFIARGCECTYLLLFLIVLLTKKQRCLPNIYRGEQKGM